jgi:hypothetical protein
MNLDWCSNDDESSSVLFNDYVIDYTKGPDLKSTKVSEPKLVELTLEAFLNINVNVTSSVDLLYVFNYLTFASNKLRNIVRNRYSINIPKTKNFKEVNAEIKDKITYEELLQYLKMIHSTTNNIKNFFNSKYKRELNLDTIHNTNKLFKTSSYKFCTFKDSCKIHKNKGKTCDKNHFVFDMLLLDLTNLIESIELISVNDTTNLYYIIDDNILLYNTENNIIEKHSSYNINDVSASTIFIDKNTVYKCFDVISYVFNKMYDEAYLFLNYNITSELINLHPN